MTSDFNPPEAPEPEEASPVADAMADAKAAFNKAGFAAPAGMVALAGLILIGVELLFGVILEEYYINWALLGAAVVAVLVFYGKGAYDRIAPAPSLLKLTGMLIAALVAFTLIYDLRYASSELNELPEILGGLFTYGAGVVAFLGARAIE
jgi:hypothetical protein